MGKGIFVMVDEELLKRFNEVAKSMGLTRSEAIRSAMEVFINMNINTSETHTHRIRGLVKSKFTLQELEERINLSKMTLLNIDIEESKQRP